MITIGKKVIQASLGQKAKDAVIKGVKVASIGPMGMRV